MPLIRSKDYSISDSTLWISDINNYIFEYTSLEVLPHHLDYVVHVAGIASFQLQRQHPIRVVHSINQDNILCVSILTSTNNFFGNDLHDL